MTIHNTANTVENRDNAYETTPVFGWGWPDETRLTDLAEQDSRAEKDERVKQIDRSIENNLEYATLYFVS